MRHNLIKTNKTPHCSVPNIFVVNPLNANAIKYLLSWWILNMHNASATNFEHRFVCSKDNFDPI